jgi:hypothetical protein
MIDTSTYCRQIETYLCKKNEGHLIRIVGPVFVQVSGWAAQGVPLAIAFKGIDQYCERYYAKGPRRRPVRIEFCEADVLELFDNWRRAVGVSAATADADGPEASPTQDSLPAHLDRAIARLTASRGSTRSAAFQEGMDAVVRELDTLRGTAKRARGEARAVILSRLVELDTILLDAARAELDAATRAALLREAEAEISPFAARMSGAAHAAAVEAAFVRLVRDTSSVPVISFER